MANKAFIREIQSAITDEIFFSIGLNRRGFIRKILGWLFSWPTRVFARNMVATDEAVANGGPAQGCQTMLSLLGVEVSVMGRENIPTEGPAIILSNHPGAYDSFAIISILPRKDLRIIASETRFYQVLPHVHPLMLYVKQDPKDRMVVIKDAVEHLHKGGILLQFGSGLIEPDPSIYQIDNAVFEKWSTSIEILLRKVPETQVVPTIASHVLLERFQKSPLTRLRRDAMDKRRLAEFMQVILQLMFPKTVKARPQISFGKPYKLDEIRQENPGKRFMPAILARARAQLAIHQKWLSGKHMH
jgi:hypothetical protein